MVILRSAPNRRATLERRVTPMKKQLTELIRHHLAISSIGPSVARGLIRKGDIQYVRKFLGRLDLREINRPTKFAYSLDVATKSLAKRLPKGRWGGARKFLNIYLRNVTYNFYLREKYRLDRVESMLELPMDSYAAKGLRAEPEGEGLPRWSGVSHLTPETSAAYQAAAAQAAARLSICRVHLDMQYWRAESGGLKK